MTSQPYPAYGWQKVLCAIGERRNEFCIHEMDMRVLIAHGIPTSAPFDVRDHAPQAIQQSANTTSSRSMPYLAPAFVGDGLRNKDKSISGKESLLVFMSYVSHVACVEGRPCSVLLALMSRGLQCYILRKLRK